MIALDPDSGQLKWYYQEIPHDVWDWDSAYEAVLLDLPVKGTLRKLLVNPDKGGYTWVLDRTNGQFINAWPLAENINWISGIDAQGNLLGRNEPPVGKPTWSAPVLAVAVVGIMQPTAPRPGCSIPPASNGARW